MRDVVAIVAKYVCGKNLRAGVWWLIEGFEIPSNILWYSGEKRKQSPTTKKQRRNEGEQNIKNIGF